MADNKDNERAELHKIIWRIANELRGSVDGWEFKTYVLGFLFYRYISENIAATINKDQKDSGSKNFDYANYDDEIAIKAKSDLIKRKGFFMKPSELFVNVRKNASNNPNLNIDLQKIFKNIELSANGASSQANLKGLFSDVDVNSNRLGSTVADINKKLVKLLNAIGDLPLGEYQTNSIDAFGDAYEYLMSMYAANAGKSGGEYFTPQEVSELLARITLINFMRSGKPDKKEIQRVYDPACGSGSLLLKFVKLIGKENVRDGFYGQEINPTTYNLARINMFLHDVGYKKFHIHHGDTLIKNARWNLRDIDKFDAIVSNPPYSVHWEGKDNPLLINDERFSPAGVLAPKSKADLAFVMHILSQLDDFGTAAIVCFPGVLYRSGAEKKIREYLIKNNFIEAIIQLPDNLFFGVTIATTIMVLRKSKDNDKNILFVDASQEFKKVDTKNKLKPENITKIVEAIRNKKDVQYFCKNVDLNTVKENDWNLSVNKYLMKEDTREVIDIKVLNNQIKETVKKQEKIRKELDAIIDKIESGK